MFVGVVLFAFCASLGSHKRFLLHASSIFCARCLLYVAGHHDAFVYLVVQQLAVAAAFCL
jgi:hypothetical protein